MKTEFELEVANGTEIGPTWNKITIVGMEPNSRPYVSIETLNNPIQFIKDKDLERFAVNILKALKSKKLNTKK